MKYGEQNLQRFVENNLFFPFSSFFVMPLCNENLSSTCLKIRESTKLEDQSPATKIMYGDSNRPTIKE